MAHFNRETFHQHTWTNRVQTLLLIAILLAIGATAGGLLFGETGMWMALLACCMALVIQPGAAPELTLRLYRAQAITRTAAPTLSEIEDALAARAGLPAPPRLYYIPSPIINAFAVGNRTRSAIALSDGLLRGLSLREIAGVLAHETAHIAHGDLRVMGLADYISRLTGLFAIVGQVLILASLPLVLAGEAEVNWTGLLVLALAPHLALLAQLGLSRVREFDADLRAAELGGDPQGLASALVRIERASRSWRSILLPGWGNPEPSWLRTHPATEERLDRLLALSARGEPPHAWHEAPHWNLPDDFPPSRVAPRWRIGGYWW